MNNTKLIFSAIGGSIATFLLFELCFYIASLGYVSIGDSYCKFGPIPAKYATFTVSFKSNYTGQLTLIDKKGKQLSNADYSVLVDGKSVGTSFKAPGKRIIRISIRGNSNKVAGRTYVRVKGGGPFITHYYFRHHSNPFVYYIISLFLVCVFAAVLWFVFIRPIKYPKFGGIVKNISINGNIRKVVFKGYRQVVLCKQRRNQSTWNKLFMGKILYVENSILLDDIIFTPQMRRGKNIGAIISVFGKNKFNYRITPNPMPKTGNTQIINQKNNITINL